MNEKDFSFLLMMMYIYAQSIVKKKKKKKKMKGTLFFSLSLLVSRYSRWDVLSIGFCSFFFSSRFFFFLCILFCIYMWRCYLIIFYRAVSHSLHFSSFKIYYHISHTPSHALYFDLFASGRWINWQNKSNEKETEEKKSYSYHDEIIIIASRFNNHLSLSLFSSSYIKYRCQFNDKNQGH